jgi:helicase
LVERGEQCLVFCKSRKDTIDVGRKISKAIKCEESNRALAEIADLEDSEGKDILLGLLQCGIAYHNSDLDWEQRRIVERWFRAKDIKVVCSTSTLAIGINLPSRNVFVDHERWGRDSSGRWARVPITQAEYENISGRAGRLGHEDQFGRAFLIADGPFQESALFDTFVQGDLGDLEPALDKSPLSQHVLNLVASGLCRTRRELQSVLLESYTGKTYWQANPELFTEQLDNAIADCMGGDLINDADTALEATEVGKLAAAKGVFVDTAVAMVEYLNSHRALALSLHPLEIIWHLTGTLNGIQVYFNLSTDESKNSEYQNLMRERLAKLDRGAHERMAAELEGFRPDYESVKRLKKALLLYDWISGSPTREIERTYHCFSGSIYGMSGEYAWLAEAFAGMAKLLDWPEDAVKDLATYPGRMIHGVPPEGVRLASLRLRGLARGRIGMLIQKGISSLEHIVRTPVETLSSMVTGNVTKRLIRKSRQVIDAEAFSDIDLDGAFDEFTGMPSDEVPEWTEEYPLSDDMGAAYKSDVAVQLDGRKEKTRYLIQLNEQDCWVTLKSFEAALILAVSAKVTELGWAGGTAFGTPDGYHQTIRRLKNDLACEGIDIEALIENSGSKQYRFSVPPQQVGINAEMILRHSPDLQRYLEEMETPAAD